MCHYWSKKLPILKFSTKKKSMNICPFPFYVYHKVYLAILRCLVYFELRTVILRYQTVFFSSLYALCLYYVDGYICPTVYSTPEWSYSVTNTQTHKHTHKANLKVCSRLFEHSPEYYVDGYICSTVYSTPEWSYSVTHTQCTKYSGESVVQYCTSVQ